MHTAVKSQHVAILCHPESVDNGAAAVANMFGSAEECGQITDLREPDGLQSDRTSNRVEQPIEEMLPRQPHVAYELNLLPDASVIGFVYPDWFGSPPAILNGYVETDFDVAIADPMVTINESGIIMSFSAAAESRLGYSPGEVLGHNVNMLIGSPDHDAQQEYSARYRTTSDQRMIGIGRRVIARCKDGSPLSLELSVGEVIGRDKRQFTAFLRDLTQNEEAEERRQGRQDDLLHYTRVGATGAIGAMASTLAHELNQPLTAVANYVQASRSLLEAADESIIISVREALAEAEGQVLRAGNIVRRLREIVAFGETKKKIEPVSEVIADSCLYGLVGAQAAGIASKVDLAPDPGPVYIDHVQIQQVLINLIRNAVEAMSPNGEGEVRIASRDNGKFVRIIIADNGPGLPPEVDERLFQAFVTTKTGKMGLSLSICRTIVEAHGGKIWHETSPGGGATFQFTLPHAEIGGTDG
jgi:two-component system sensor kinase FixL